MYVRIASPLSRQSTLDTDPALPRDECAFECTDRMRGNGKCDAACMNAACHFDADREGGANTRRS